MATSMPESGSLKILCLGDSLTEGFSSYGMSMTPYSETLEVVLEAQFGTQRKVEVTTDGVSGDAVTGGTFKKRMDKRYSFTSSTPLYDYTLFLGGTNDLGWGFPASKIWTSIKTITDLPLVRNSKVILFTVPECGVKSEDLDARRDELNALIRADADEGKSGRRGIYVFDLHKAIPYHSMSRREQEEIWDDGLHFTPEGYERMGELVAKRLLEVIGEVEGAGKVGE